MVSGWLGSQPAGGDIAVQSAFQGLVEALHNAIRLRGRGFAQIKLIVESAVRKSIDNLFANMARLQDVGV